MLRILLSRALLIALPFVAYWAWREVARRSGRAMGDTPWGWLAGAAAALVGLSLMGSVALRPDNRGERYVPAEAHPGGGVTPGAFDPSRRASPQPSPAAPPLP